MHSAVSRALLAALIPTVLFVSTDCARAETVFVDWQASGPANDGASWATAFRTIQAGVDAAAPGDTVWVRYGSYYETVAISTAGVSLLGGFLGGETDASQRRSYARPVISCRDRPGAGVAISADNVMLDGFEVTRTAIGNPPPATYTGPGVYVSGNNATVSRNAIAGHVGGIVCAYSADATMISDNIITGNHAMHGGGVSCGNAALVRNIITNNYVEGVGAWARGGGVFVDHGTVQLEDNVIARNVALSWSTPYGPTFGGDARGGGVAVAGGAVRMANNTFVDNAAIGGAQAVGGAISVDNGTLVVLNNIFTRNSATLFADGGPGKGGILWLDDDPYDTTPPTATGRNNLVFQNAPDDALPAAITGTVSADPLFASSNDLHLKPGSPAIDAGYNEAVSPDDRDVDGQSRVLGPTVDIGAYESRFSTAPRTLLRAYIGPGGSDRNSGASWAEAKRTLGSALSVTMAGGEVWAAAGRYDERLTIPDGVALYGGFTGTETARDQRDFRANATVLDAEYRGNAVIIPAGTKNVTLDGLTIRRGRARLYYGYPDSFGGGIHSEGENVTITNCIVEDNEYSAYEDNPTAWGGGIYASGGSIRILNSIIRRNRLAIVQGMTFPQFGNLAEGDGGGIALVNTTATVANNLIAGNEITIGGAMSQYAALGAGLFANGVYGRIVNNTFVDNSSTETTYLVNGQIVRFGGTVHLAGASPLFANNIVAFNGSGVGNPGGASFLHNNVHGNGADYSAGNYTGLNGNISEDPLFANRAAGDFHLAPVSPSVDAGDSALALGDVDLDGRPRILGAAVDMGAYETAAGTPLTMGDAAGALRIAAGLSSSSPDTAPRLDLDGGGVVDIRDAAAIARAVAEH